MKNILIIGGSRFVGPQLINKLLKDGNNITIFNRGNNYGQKLPKSVKRIIGDRSSLDDLNKLNEYSFDIVYDMICFDPDEIPLLLKVVKPKKHIVFFSSAAVYKKSSIYPFYETSKVGPWSTFGDYGERKVQIEKEYTKYCIKNGIKLTILRPTYLLGKDNYFDRENYFFSRIINEDPILLPGSADAVIQLVFLEDTVEAFFKIPKLQKKQIEIVNIGGNDLISIKNFILLCGRIVGKKPKLVSIKSGEYGIFEEEFYDDFYPFPNVTFIVSNKIMVDEYAVIPTRLQSGLKAIYKKWIKKWDGKTHLYKLEKEILTKMRTDKKI